MVARRFAQGLFPLAVAGLLTFGIALPVAGVPNERDGKAKGYVFPPGKFVLGGGPQAATAPDVYGFKKPFALRPGQYILSGGPSPSDRIVVDDDLEVSADGKPLFIDDDHVASTDSRPASARVYDGSPIILVLDPAKKLHVRAIDHCPNEAILGELYLHRYDGARKKLAEKIVENSAPNLPHVFFDRDFDLENGFEAAPSAKDVMELPAIPASLLGRGNKAAPGTKKDK